MFASSRIQNSLRQLLLAVATISAMTAFVQPSMASTGSSSNSPMAAEDVYENTLHATVLIDVFDARGNSLGRGTGWIADRNRRLLITNHHVIANARLIHVYFPHFRDGELMTDMEDYQYVKPQVATVVDSQRSLDLATITVPALPRKARSLKLAANSARPASRVHTVGGKPAGSTGLFSYATGSVRQIQNSGLSVYGTRVRTIETNLGANPGNSGGAIVNDQSEVVGVLTSGSTNKQVINAVVIGVDVDLVRQYIDTVTDLLTADTADKCNALGMRHFIDGRHGQAIDLFSRAIKMDSRRSEFVENRAASFYLAGDVETALTNVNQAIKMNATSARSFAIRAHIHNLQNDRQRAIADWTKAISIEPTAARYAERGMVRSTLQEFDKAITDLSRAISMNPQASNFRSERALAHANLKQWDKALQDASDAIEINSNDARTFNTMGFVLFQKNDFEPAFKAFAKAANLNPNEMLYQLNAGRALTRLGDNQNAIKWFDAVLKVQPKNAEAKQEKLAAMNSNAGRTQTAQRPVNRQVSQTANNNPLIGTWSLNVAEGSNYLHAYITLGAGGQYGGVVQSLNQDRTVNEQLIDGTWHINGNQLTITTRDSAATTYTVQLSGKTLKAFQNGQLACTYRKIS